MSSFSDFGSGTGFLYITEANGTTLISSVQNTWKGRRTLLKSAATQAPVGGEVIAVGTLTVNVGAGTVTTVTVNGVAIMGAVAATGATVTLLAADVASKINSTVSAPEYSAMSIAGVVYIFAAPGSGTTPNGFVVAGGVTAPTTVTATNMAGGSDGSGIYAPTTGYRYFINSSSAAVQAVVAGSTEISSYLINRGLNNSMYGTSATISAGIVSPARVSNTTVLTVDTEAAAASDDLDIISAVGYANNDTLIITGANAGRIVTVKNGTFPGTDNIILAGGTDFLTNGSGNSICLQYRTTTSAAVPAWCELWRSPVLPTVANLRTQSIAMPAQGTTDTTLVAGGGTINLTPGTSKEFQYFDGSAALVGNYVIQGAGTPINGDRFVIDYNATMTLGAFSITIFGIALTATQALEGGYRIEAFYDGPVAAYRAQIFKSVLTEDLVDTTQLATKEPGLGNPAATGYVLSSTTGGTRSWIPNANNQVLYNTTANNQTTAITTLEVLKTYTVAASTMDINGDKLIISGVFQTAANANNKTVSLNFGAMVLGTLLAAANADTFIVYAEVNRITNTTQSAYCTIQQYDTATGVIVTSSVFYTTPAETLSGTVAVQFCGLNGVAAAGDIISRQGSVSIAKFRS